MNTTTFRDQWFSHGKANVLAGLTSSFALVPECIAFALVAQLNPLMGLYGAFFICTITALFGGRPGMISGAAGSMAVVIVALVAQQRGFAGAEKAAEDSYRDGRGQTRSPSTTQSRWERACSR